MRKLTFDTIDAKPLAARQAQRLAEAKARKPWPPETPCSVCGQPVGKPVVDRLVPSKPVCPTCMWDRLMAAVFPKKPSRRR